MNFQRIFTGLAFCLLFSSSYANPYQRYPVSPPDMSPSPATVLKQGIDQLTNYLANGDAPNSPPLDVFLESTIAPFFDFAYMAKWIAGARVHYMSPQQGAELEQKLRRTFLIAMVDKLDAYRHGRVKFLRNNVNPRSGEVRLGLLAFQKNNSYPQRLTFKMYRSPQGWKVYDVSSDGQSALAFFRTQFAMDASKRPGAYYGAHPGRSIN